MVATLTAPVFTPDITRIHPEQIADILGGIAAERLTDDITHDVTLGARDMVCGRCGDYIADVPALAAVYDGRAIGIAATYTLGEALGDAAHDHRAECADPEPYD